MLRLMIVVALIVSLPSFALANDFSAQLALAQQQLSQSPSQSRASLLRLAQDDKLSSQPSETLIQYYLLRVQTAQRLKLNDEVTNYSIKGLAIAANHVEHQQVQRQLELILIEQYVGALKFGPAQTLIGQISARLKDGKAFSYRARLQLQQAKLFDKQQREDLGLLAYKKAYDLAKQGDEEQLVQSISLSLASRLLALNDFESAAPLLESSNNYYVKNKLSTENIVVQIKLSELAYSRGEQGKALVILVNARNIAQVIDSGLFRFVLTLRISELQLEAQQIAGVAESLDSLEALQIHARRSDDKERLLLVQARYLVAIDDYVALNQLLINHGEFELTGLSKGDDRVLALLQLKAKGLAATGHYEQAYQMLVKNQQDLVTNNQRRNADNLQRQKLMFDVELLEQKNRDLSSNNNMQQSQIERNDQTLSQMSIAILIIATVAGSAILCACVLYIRRQQFYKLTYKDPLTGLYNRRYLYLIMKKFTRKHLKYHQPLTAIMLDLDHFKRVNDSYGHDAGDQVLVAFAQCCQRILPPESVIIRLGGEEILALLPHWQCLEGTKIAETLRAAIEHTTVTTDDGKRLSVTVSIGVASLGGIVTEQKGLLKLADQRLYIAKSQGRNQVIGAMEPQANVNRASHSEVL